MPKALPVRILKTRATRAVAALPAMMVSVLTKKFAHYYSKSYSSCTGRNSVLQSSGLQTVGPPRIGIIVSMATGFADHAINKVITYFFKVLYSSGINIMTSP